MEKNRNSKKKPEIYDWIGLFIFLTLSGRISGLLIYFFIDSSSDHYKAVKFLVWVIIVTIAGIFWKSKYMVSGKVPTRNDEDL